MLKHPMAFATLAVALAACGTEDARTPVPVEEIGDPVKYFGVEPCTCYEFLPEGGGSRLGIAVEAVTTSVIGNPDDAEEYVMRYRVGGVETRQYVFRPTDPDLLLRQIRTGGVTGSTWSSTPALPWIRFPAEPRDQPVEATAELSELLSGNPPTEVAFRANYVGATVEASLDGGETTQTFDATRISYQGLPFNEQFRWFVPEVGLVRVELETNQGRTNYILNRKYQLGGTCPVADLGTPDEICGVDVPN